MNSRYPFILPAAISLVIALAPRAWAQDKPPVEQQKGSTWQTTASAGMTLTRGNSDTFLASLSASTIRKWEQNQLSLGADATYGTTKDRSTGTTTRTADSYHGYAQYDRLFSKRLYAYGRVGALYDSIADITYRFTLSPGAGYYLIKETNTDLSIELGPGYVIQKLGNDRSSYPTLRVGEKAHHALNDRARVWETVEWLPKFEDFSNYIMNAEIGIAASLTQDKRMSLSCILQDSYNSVPAVGRLKNDMKLITALNYRF